MALTVVETKSKITGGQFRIAQKRGKSKVWDIFGHVIGQENNEIPNIVACRACFSVFKFTGATSNLVRHKCYKASKLEANENVPEPVVDAETKLSVTKAVTKWVVQNCRPFTIISDSGIKDVISLALEIGSRFGSNVNVKKLLPHPTTVSRNISELYHKELHDLTAEIALMKGNGYSITTDAWTDRFSQKSYICVTLHYIFEGSMKTRLLKIICMNDEPSTGTH